ncbi:MAG: hypothetical protein AB2L14_15890 [Candidatus Xenobiia bacterium LiM19]
MESIFLFPEQFRAGTQSPAAGGLSGALLLSMLKSLDLKPGVLCEATVIQQQGKSCTLQIGSQTITAELPAEEQMPEKVMLRFLSARAGADPVISMQIAGSEALSLKSYVVDTNPEKLSTTIKAFMPSLTESQSELLFKLLPYFKGDLHENLASFAYLLGLDEEKLQAHILEQSGDRTAPRELAAALRETRNILSSCPCAELTGEEHSVLNTIIRIIDTMQKKIAGAKNLCPFIDDESAPLSQNMKYLMNGSEVMTAAGEEAAGLREQLSTTGKEAYTSVKTEDEAKSGKNGAAIDDRTGSVRRSAFHSSRTDVKGIDENLRNNGGERLDSPSALTGHDGKEIPNGSDRHAVLEYLSREVSVDRLMDRTLKAPSQQWNTTYAWKTVEDSRIMKGISVEERKQGAGNETQREYQVSFQLSLPRVGDTTCVVYWMEHSIGCRIVCDSAYSHSLFELHRSMLEERFKERGISCMHIKVEHGG